MRMHYFIYIMSKFESSLDENLRIPAHNPGISHVYQIYRDWTIAFSNQRTSLFKKILDNRKWVRVKLQLSFFLCKFDSSQDILN